MSQSAINDNNNCFNTSNTSHLDVWNNHNVADDRSQVLTWLSPLGPNLQHRDLQECRVDNVGQWLLQIEEFRRWYDMNGEGEGDNAVLFCHGDQGTGKSFISSILVDRLCDPAGGPNAAIACFYFDSTARREQTAASMLGSLLKQIVSQTEMIPEEISRAFRERGGAIGGPGPGLPDIVKMLQTVSSSQRTFMCIDAMDECAVVHRVELLDSLKKVLEKSPSTRIFVTGRPHIQSEIERHLPGRVRSVSMGNSKGDIVGYIRFRLRQDKTPDAMDESLEADILHKIPENISETFLLVSLNIEAILEESTIHRRREKLSKMTDGLGLEDPYCATIARVKAQGGDKSILGIAALMWISHAERPLREDELCHALAVELGSTDIDTCNTTSMSALVSYCQGLITVDKEASTVRLIHFTLQEYLFAHPDIFSRPHSTMAEMCLTYLNSKQVKALSDDPSLDTLDTPFLEYCSVYWGAHAKREPSKCATSLALKLLQEPYGRVSTKILLAQVEHLHHWEVGTWSPFSGLHCASFFGIAEVVAELIEMGCSDINAQDFLGYTPLTWAAHNGHEEVVKMLLGREGVNPEMPNNYDQTPLSFAARGGHEAVVKILLGRKEVDPDRPSKYGGTPLSFAARGGHEGVVKILLGREEVSPDKQNSYGQTPLSFAARGGHERVVKMLLGRTEVNPDQQNSYGQTPLSFAARGGHEAVVKILLGRKEVDPDKPSNRGKTPLSYAAWNGHEGVVKILLWRAEVDINKPDNFGRTPLLDATAAGREGVVRILLGWKEVHPQLPDYIGKPPLSYAAEAGHEDVVKLLLGSEDINPNKPNNHGSTPLSFAAANGQEGVVKILLEQKDVDPDNTDNRGKTPLSYAAAAGHEGVVKILLGRKDVDPDRLDDFGGTPLLIASMQGHKRVVALLRSRNAVIL